MPHLLTFIHRSPYATWNSLQAWIRQAGAAPDEVAILHLPAVGNHASMVKEGVERLLRHYGAEPKVRLVPVPDNGLPAWSETISNIIASDGDWTIDVTPARTIPKLASMEALRASPETAAVYLDVEGYRYEPKPFSWVPYNVQTVRTLTPGTKEATYRNVQFFGSFPRVAPMDRLGAGPKLDVEGNREIQAHWESLVVLLNEAGAAATGKKGTEGLSKFEIKIPHLGVTVGTYDMERSRLVLEPQEKVLEQLANGLGFLSGAWAHDVPGYNDVLEALTAAHILPYANHEQLRRLLHSAALSTGGPAQSNGIKWIGMDTNALHLQTITTIARDRRIPLSRLPLVVSSVVRGELEHQMQAELPQGDMPTPVANAHVHRPRKARLAHVANEEFELLSSRSRMETHIHRAGKADNDANDQSIVDDMAHFAAKRHEPVIFLTNDRGCHARAEATHGLEAVEILFGNPDLDLDPSPAIDKIAYFIYRLSLSFGRISLKGLGVEVFGDHPQDKKHAYLHEEIRVRVPDKDWTRGFVHEVSLKDKLAEVVKEAGVWL